MINNKYITVPAVVFVLSLIGNVASSQEDGPTGELFRPYANCVRDLEAVNVDEMVAKHQDQKTAGDYIMNSCADKKQAAISEYRKQGISDERINRYIQRLDPVLRMAASMTLAQAYLQAAKKDWEKIQNK